MQEEFAVREGGVSVLTEARDDAVWRNLPVVGDTVYLRPIGKQHDILVRVEAHEGEAFKGRVVSFTDGTPGLMSPMGYAIGQSIEFTEPLIQTIEIGCDHPA